jgi:DNA-directed RNA polymerase specialized sigma24 family protein
VAKLALRARVSSAAGTTLFAGRGYEDFYKASFRNLARAAMIAGATLEEAEDATAKALAEMSPGWPDKRYTFAYARKAVISNFIREKTRGPGRVARRLRDRGHVPHREGADDPGLTRLENDEWVADVLSCLPPAQREVMGCFARGLEIAEIAETLGKTNETTRKHISDACKRLRAELHPDGERKHQQRRGRKEAR